MATRTHRRRERGLSNGPSNDVIISSSPTLNFDVLCNVMQFLHTPGDLSQLMKTCKSLYSVGIPLLLGGIIYLGWRRQILSFCKFMLSKSNRAERIRHFRRLSLCCIIWSDGRARRVGTLLAKVLKGCHSLEYLSMNSPGHFLAADPAIPTLLGRLSGLQTLIVEDGTENMAEILRTLHCPLTRLQLSFDQYAYIRQSDLFTLINNCSETLTNLALSDLHLKPHTIPSEMSCSRVRSLAIRADRLDSLRHIVHAFPVVTRFEFSSINSPVPWAASTRQTNSRPEWFHLDYLRARPGNVYEWNMAQPIRYWDMGSLSSWETTILGQVLADCPPTCLALELNPNREMGGDLGSHEEALALTQVFKIPSVTHLSLQFVIDCDDDKQDHQARIQEAIGQTEGSTITFLSLSFRNYVHTRPASIAEGSQEAEEELNYDVDYSWDSDTTTFATRVAKANTSLSHFYLEYEGFPSQFSTSFWSIQRTESGEILLHDSEKNRAIEMMDNLRKTPGSTSFPGWIPSRTYDNDDDDD